MVLEFVSSLKQVLQPHHFSIDCAVSKLHYRFTVGLIFLFCILVTSRQYFGDPIACMGATPIEVPKEVLDTYCWIQATYTLPAAYHTKVGVDGVPHPGVASINDKKTERRYHNYYQWIFAIDVFLGGAFREYGIDVVKFTQMDDNDRTDPMIQVFPRVTKCIFHKYGPSGTVQRHDSLCVLPLNIVNEKIYLIMWFWFVVLAIVTSIWLIWLVVLMFVWRQGRFYVITGVGKYADPIELKEVCKKIDYGDWLLVMRR
uniref:Innexin n=1 Tax=Strigamia maritima TaxID=126957 RepID=T1JN41_STRMM